MTLVRLHQYLYNHISFQLIFTVGTTIKCTHRAPHTLLGPEGDGTESVLRPLEGGMVAELFLLQHRNKHTIKTLVDVQLKTTVDNHMRALNRNTRTSSLTSSLMPFACPNLALSYIFAMSAVICLYLAHSKQFRNEHTYTKKENRSTTTPHHDNTHYATTVLQYTLQLEYINTSLQHQHHYSATTNAPTPTPLQHQYQHSTHPYSLTHSLTPSLTWQQKAPHPYHSSSTRLHSRPPS